MTGLDQRTKDEFHDRITAERAARGQSEFITSPRFRLVVAAVLESHRRRTVEKGARPAKRAREPKT